MSDITYEINDEANNKSKIVHFDLHKKAPLRAVKLDQSDNKSYQLSKTDSDGSFEIASVLRQHFPRKLAAPELAHQA